MNPKAHIRIGMLFLFFAAVACAGSATQPATSSPPTQEATPIPPTDTPAPTRTPNPFPNPVLKIVGDEEIVFDWTTDQCEPENIPDLAARAFRDASNQVQLILSHYVNYRMVGPDLNSVKSDCQRVLASDYNPDPSFYDDSEWLASPYTEDGQTIYALIHDEYRGHTHPGACPQNDYFACLDTSITLAISTDGGNTYTDAATPPGNLVATLPHQAEAGSGPFGMRNPSNIIRGKDGYFYAYSNISDYRTQDQWVCVMRTDDLSDPKSWRFWDGTDFNGEFINPYVDPLTDRDAHKCAPLDWDHIGASLNDGIAYNEVMDRYVLIGNSADQIEGREVWGWYYAFSDDLIHWSHRKLLLEVALPWTVSDTGRDLSYLYPTLLDPDSTSRNFETTDQTTYLYVTRMNHGAGSLDRDLIRYPVEFFGSEGEYLDSQP